MKIIAPAPEPGPGGSHFFPTLERGIQVLDDNGNSMEDVVGIDIRIRPGKVVEATVIHRSPQCEIHAVRAAETTWGTIRLPPGAIEKMVAWKAAETPPPVPPAEVPVTITIEGHSDPRVNGEYRKVLPGDKS